MRFEINNGLLANCIRKVTKQRLLFHKVLSIGVCAFGDNNKTN